MPKPPGAGAEWTSVKKFNNTFPQFLKWLTKYHDKALAVLGETLDDKDASVNLRHSAAKEVNSMYLKFHSQLKNAKAADYAPKETEYEKHKKVLAKQKEAGISLLQTEYIPEENEGTNG